MGRSNKIAQVPADVITLQPGHKNLVVFRLQGKETMKALEDFNRWAVKLQEKLGPDNVVLLVPPGLSVEVLPLSIKQPSCVKVTKRDNAKWNF